MSTSFLASGDVCRLLIFFFFFFFFFFFCSFGIRGIGFIKLELFFFFFFFFFLHYNRKFHFDLYDLHLKRERKKEHGKINIYFDLS